MKALQDGRVRIEGVDLNFINLRVEETFFRQLRHQEFDMAELSLSSYVLTLNQEHPPFIALPIFPSRFFRHQSIYINKNSGIKSPADLKGKRAACPEWQMVRQSSRPPKKKAEPSPTDGSGMAARNTGGALRRQSI